MGGYNDLKTAIAALIRTNDNQEITGATLQSALLSIINTIGQGSVFKGVATTSTNPGSPDADVFYIAGRPGYYPNFNLELTAGLHVIENKSGAWVNTEIQLDVVDAINIGGAKHVKPSQAMIVALQSVEQIPDSEGLANKMWWSTDGHLKYRHNDTVYDLGNPAYVLYYCGNQIYKWTGSGFQEIGGGGTFASGEAVSNMSIFDDGSDTDGKSSAQLAAMIPSGEVIKSLLEIISSIETSGGSYDGVDLITTFSYDASTRVITVKQSGRQAKTILLPLANSTNAGLMSSEDKTQLASMQNLIGKTVNSFSKSTGETGIIITLVTSNGTPHAVLIPIVSSSEPGLVTPEIIQQYINNKANLVSAGNLAGDMLSMDEWPRTVISNISSEDMPSVLSSGDVYFVPRRQQGSTIRPAALWIYVDGTNDVNLGTPTNKVVYCHKATGNLYIWDLTNANFVQVGGSNIDPSTLAGKTDKHLAADILTPSQWPHVMIYNIESMWGAGGTPPDYASIPVGSIYLDDSDSIDDPPYRRLFYKKTLEGTSQRIDLGAPQENTIYCHIATGKLYRWVPTQNGNDGAFQQVGGDIVLPHIGQNGNWWVGPETDPNNDTGTKAQGPKGNSVVDGDTFDIVNNLIDGGEADALSAEMGLRLKSAIIQLWTAIGNYAFPGGRPVLDFSGGGSQTEIAEISTIFGQRVTPYAGESSVSIGDQLIVQLSTSDDLYVINPSTVKVMMGGTDITASCYNENTDIVNIPTVIDDVEITAYAMTYVGFGEQNSPLVLMFDGKNQGSTANQWENLANANKPLVLSGGYTNNTDNVQFDGTNGRGIIQNFGTDLPYDTATLEAVLSFAVLPSSDTYLFGSGNDHNSLLYVGAEQGNTGRRLLFGTTVGEHSSTASNNVSARFDTAVNNFPFSVNQIISLSRQGLRFTLDKNELTLAAAHAVIVGDSQSVFNAAGYIFVSGCTTRNNAYYAPFNGKMYCIRAYTRALTELEVAQNYKVDKKRFNIA